MKYITFVTPDDKFQISILASAASKIPTDENMYELINKYNLTRYLHNENDYAILDKQTNTGTYWLKGVLIPDKEFEARLHNARFHKKVEDFLNE